RTGHGPLSFHLQRVWNRARALRHRARDQLCGRLRGESGRVDHVDRSCSWTDLGGDHVARDSALRAQRRPLGVLDLTEPPKPRPMESMYTTSTAILEALREAGMQYVFANLGSDHSGFLETIAAAEAAGNRERFPAFVTCPDEMVALSAAHGFALASGRAQAVLVHVECGTQQLAGAVHNAAKGRVPVLILAGLSPATQEGEARGSRNEFIHWLQDVFDQRGIVRGYMRYDNEIRVGANAKQIVNRALQFACSEPQGPAYLVAAREVLEAQVDPVAIDRAEWPPIAPCALAPESAAQIARLLAAARRPLIVTSYLGRSDAAVTELVTLCKRVGAGVLESVPSAMNYPSSEPLHQGVQWNEKRQHPALAEADTILVVASDVPWIPQINRPSATAHIVHIDIDPLKEQMPLWYIHAREIH